MGIHFLTEHGRHPIHQSPYWCSSNLHFQWTAMKLLVLLLILRIEIWSWANTFASDRCFRNPYPLVRSDWQSSPKPDFLSLKGTQNSGLLTCGFFVRTHDGGTDRWRMGMGSLNMTWGGGARSPCVQPAYGHDDNQCSICHPVGQI